MYDLAPFHFFKILFFSKRNVGSTATNVPSLSRGGKEEGGAEGLRAANVGRTQLARQAERSELCDSGSEGKEGGEMEERGGTEEKDGRGCAPARAPLTRVQRARKAKAASDKAAKAR